MRSCVFMSREEIATYEEAIAIYILNYIWSYDRYGDYDDYDDMRDRRKNLLLKYL